MTVEGSNLYFHKVIKKVTGGKFVGIGFTILVLKEVDSEKSFPQPSPSISGLINSNLGISLPIPCLVRASEEEVA